MSHLLRSAAVSVAATTAGITGRRAGLQSANGPFRFANAGVPSGSPTRRRYPAVVALYRLDDPGDLLSPVLVVALDGWVDAGGAATTAAERLAVGGQVVVPFDADALFDYRARRPTLGIVDGQPTSLVWPELVIRRAKAGDRDLLVLTGPEPDYRWQELARDAVMVCERLGISEWISLGAIPAAVPHTRPVPIIGTASRPGLLRGDVQAGPARPLGGPPAPP